MCLSCTYVCRDLGEAGHASFLRMLFFATQLFGYPSLPARYPANSSCPTSWSGIWAFLEVATRVCNLPNDDSSGTLSGVKDFRGTCSREVLGMEFQVFQVTSSISLSDQVFSGQVPSSGELRDSFADSGARLTFCFLFPVFQQQGIPARYLSWEVFCWIPPSSS